MSELAIAVSRAQEPDQIYRAAVRGLVDVLGADRASVVIQDANGVMRFKSWIGLSDEYRTAAEGSDLVQQCKPSTEPIAIPDLMNDPALRTFRPMFAGEGIGAVLVIPLLGTGGLIGKFVLYYNQPHEFQTEELEIAQTIAADVAFAADRQQSNKALRNSERRLAVAHSAAQLGVWECDLRTGTIAISGDYNALNGLPRDRRSLTIDERFGLLHPDDRARIRPLMRESIDRGGCWNAEFRVVWPDGSIHWLMGKGTVFFDDSGQASHMAGVNLDITARKRDEEQHLRLAAIVESSEDAIFSKNLDATIMSWNSGAARLFGYTSEEITGKSISHLLPPERLHELPQILERIRSGAHLEHHEVTLMCKDGRRVDTSMTISPISSGGAIVGSSTIARDITERKLAEEALRLSQQRLDLCQEAGGIGTWDWDVASNRTYCSKGYSRLYGLQEIEVAPPPEEWLKLIHPEDRRRLQEEFSQALDGARPYNSEFRVVWPDGTVHWLFGKGEVFRDSNGKPVRMLGVNMDITEHKRASQALRESEERFWKIADAAPVMIWTSGPDKLCTFFNASWLAFTGRTMEQECGNGWAEGVHPADLDRCIAHYCSSFDVRQSFQMEYRLRRADGQYRWILDNGIPRFEPSGAFAGYIGSCIDITEIRRAREEDLARQKLESVGVLAGGVAHDFNNLVGAILAEAELAAAQLAAGESPADGIQRIAKVAGRCAEIVRQLMIYAGQDKVDPIEPLDLSKLVEEMLELLKVSISKHAVLKTDLAKNLPAIGGGASRIRQIVMNLIINASEAIEETGGEIKIATSRRVLSSDSDPDNPMYLPVGEYISLEISDTGAGMSEEVQAKIFDPFFTTKFAGRGLRLAVVQRIVRDQGGAINLFSTPGKGSTFRIMLPCIAGAAPSNPTSSTPTDETHRRPSSATVLIVDDEDVLRLATSKMLQRSGFQVIQAREGSSALELVRAHEDDIDVMLLDITLPGISSREVFAEARQLRPNLKVILTSAYDREATHASFEGLPTAGFIRKPFRMADLVSLLGEALSA